MSKLAAKLGNRSVKRPVIKQGDRLRIYNVPESIQANVVHEHNEGYGSIVCVIPCDWNAKNGRWELVE